nr:hypothetical protein [Tanacetum cinerariifolium]
GRKNRGHGNNARGAGAAGYREAQNIVAYANLGGPDNIIDDDVDEQPIQDLALNTLFMANLSSTYPVYDEADLSYDSDILSEYIKNNAVPVVQTHVSSVPNDAYMIILNDMHEQPAQNVYVTPLNNVVNKSLIVELAIYKEQVELYERRARIKLTEREQKIDEQLRIVITDRNFKEENLIKELDSVKMQLASIINHNKSMVEDKLFKQDQSLQTVHMLCKPKPYYDEQYNVAIGYKNPVYLTHEKQVQPALYNGHEIIKINHVPTIGHNSEETLEIAEITRKKMNVKMNDLECVIKKVKIAPYLATFTPQKQLTPKQIFWSKDLIKMKAEALKEKTTASRPMKALTVYSPNTPATLVPKMLPTKKIFEELEVEVDQNVVHIKHDEIEQKNLLITNGNLIADCLSKDVFYTATDYVLTVFRFSDMHKALHAAQKRIPKLEYEISNMQNKIQNDDQM